MTNVLVYLGLAAQVVNGILVATGAILSGQPASAPTIRTYIGKQHVSIDITVTPLS